MLRKPDIFKSYRQLRLSAYARGYIGARHRGRLLYRRWRLEPGYHLRGDDHGGGAETAGRLCVREQPVLRGNRVDYDVGSHNIAERAAGFGLVSDDNFFAVPEAAGEAVERAHAGGGPSAIEVDTCRFYGHHLGYAQLYHGKDEVRRLRDERIA